MTTKDVDNLNYWKNPGDNNSATNYLDTEKNQKRTESLFKIIEKYATKEFSILELGCNVGRNLNKLYREGYKNVIGIEISELAVKVGEKEYPELRGKIMISAIEDKIKELPPYDIIFTRAVLEHIMTTSEWIFPEIERMTKGYLITIEYEKSSTWKHYPRNYKEVFKNMEQVEERIMTPEDGLSSDFVLRVFKKKRKK